jgi:hypothetical protein
VNKFLTKILKIIYNHLQTKHTHIEIDVVFSSIIKQLHLQNDTLENGSLAIAKKFSILNCKHVPNQKRLSKINQKLRT